MRIRLLSARAARLVLAALLATACTSTGDDAPTDAAAVAGPPTQVTWHLFKTGQVIALVNEAHTDRVELYSQVREEAGPKVTTDAIMDGLVDFFVDEQHFDEHAQPGPAPTAGTEQYSQAIELRVDDDVSHMLLGPSSTPEQRETFNACAEAVMTIWNWTYQAQAVQNEQGKDIFVQPGTNIRYKDE